MPNSTVTTSREDDKLIIVRKPVLPTRQQKFLGCVLPTLMVVFIVWMICGYFVSNGNEDIAVSILLTFSIVTFVVIILAIRDKLRNRKSVLPPDYAHEVLTFDVNRFVVQYRGVISSFSYRFDAKLVLRHTAAPHWNGLMEVIIPCNPLDDYVPEGFYYGFYCMWIDSTDTERIFVELKEYLETVKSMKDRVPPHSP